MEANSVDKTVIVQPICYRYDNRCAVSHCPDECHVTANGRACSRQCWLGAVMCRLLLRDGLASLRALRASTPRMKPRYNSWNFCRQQASKASDSARSSQNGGTRAPWCVTACTCSQCSLVQTVGARGAEGSSQGQMQGARCRQLWLHVRSSRRIMRGIMSRGRPGPLASARGDSRA